MRVAPGQVAGILRDPAAVAVLLLYGDDQGLIRDRAGQASRAVLGDGNDPFRSSVLTREEHGRILDEARSLSLTGGRRVVRVLDAGDALTVPLSRVEGGGQDCLIILEGAALTPRSKLRALAENRPDWAAIGCKPATDAAIAAEIRAAVQSAGCTILSDAVQMLTALLPADTAARQSELGKLITYAGSGGTIDDDALLGCCADLTEISFPLLFEAILSGDVEGAGKLTQQAIDDGSTGAGLIAAFGTYLQRVTKLRLLIDSGISAEAACGMLLPPAFPRQASGLIRQVRGWTRPQLLSLLADLKTADQACKRGGSRDTTIAGHLMLVTARRAARGHR